MMTREERRLGMIIKKSPRDIDAMAKAGELSARALRVVGAAVKPGVTTLELDRIAEETIRQGGGIPAFKGYGGFPGSICASINEQIVHGIPSDAVVLQEGDIISIDTGATVGGWVGDNAWTFPVGKISPKKQRLLEVTEETGEVVADICAGSGTTAVAALNTGRRFVCFETAPAFYGPATERIRRAREAVAGGGKGE